MGGGHHATLRRLVSAASILSQKEVCEDSWLEKVSDPGL